MTKDYRWKETDQLQYVAADQVDQILNQNKRDLIDLVAATYLTFYAGQAINPDTYSLKFPKKPNSRINALPGYVGGNTDLAGIKWVSSFPDNVENNLQRAAACIVLNSFKTGYPLAVLDGTKISSARTVASAALAARCLKPLKKVDNLILYGAGIIHRTLLEFMKDDGWLINRVIISDPDPTSVRNFQEFCEKVDYPCVEMETTFLPQDADMISFATSALESWYDFEILDHQVFLHISLRDVVPARLNPVRNIVDDVDHAVKANTSLHLLKLDKGSIPSLENFYQILNHPPLDPQATVVSAFGMGILDIAFADYIMKKAEEVNQVLEIEGFMSPQARW